MADDLDTISLQISNAIKTTLQTYLTDYLSAMPRNIYWHFAPEIPEGSQIPAIGIYGTGEFDVISRCAQGNKGDGTTEQGAQDVEWKFKIIVWQAGANKLEAEQKVNRWLDAMRACFDVHYKLGEAGIASDIAAGRPYSFPNAGDGHISAGELTMVVSTWAQAGDTTLPDA